MKKVILQEAENKQIHYIDICINNEPKIIFQGWDIREFK